MVTDDGKTLTWNLAEFKDGNFHIEYSLTAVWVIIAVVPQSDTEV